MQRLGTLAQVQLWLGMGGACLLSGDEYAPTILECGHRCIPLAIAITLFSHTFRWESPDDVSFLVTFLVKEFKVGYSLHPKLIQPRFPFRVVNIKHHKVGTVPARQIGFEENQLLCA